jgi:hypothetical protein
MLTRSQHAGIGQADQPSLPVDRRVGHDRGMRGVDRAGDDPSRVDPMFAHTRKVRTQPPVSLGDGDVDPSQPPTGLGDLGEEPVELVRTLGHGGNAVPHGDAE